MKRKYIISNIYTSHDWHDMALVVEQERSENGFTFDNPEEYIANKIYEELTERLPELTVAEIKTIMNSGENKNFKVVIKKEGYIMELSIDIYGSNPYGYCIEYEDGFDAIQTYKVCEIEDDDLCFLVSEHIVNAGKGCSLLERCYHELFDNYAEAEEYRIYMQSLVEPWNREGSGFKICICSRKKMEQTKWYKDNLTAIRCIDNMGGVWTDYRFYHGCGVQEKYYEWLMEKSFEREIEMLDREIYMRIIELLPLEEREEINGLIDHAKNRSELRTVVDSAILRCFALCESQEDFMKIYEKLDIYSGRIKDIGKEIIGLAPEGHEYFVVSKKGKVKYYKHINNDDRPFDLPDDPFQNFWYVTKCMESFEYHHLFVDEFPEV